MVDGLVMIHIHLALASGWVIIQTDTSANAHAAENSPRVVTPSCHPEEFIVEGIFLRAK